MAKSVDKEAKVNRKLRIRDLQVLSAVVERGSMGKAATHLGVTQPAVSEVISDLEHTFGARLVDRTPRGIEPTIYGRALLKRSIAIFDELSQSIKDIEYLRDPSVGTVTIGCPESISAGFLPPLIHSFTQEFPRIALRVDQVVTPTLELPELRARKLDLVIARLGKPLSDYRLDEELKVTLLFNDELVVAAGAQSRWCRRKKIDFKELMDAEWLLPPEDTWNTDLLEQAFDCHGLEAPKASLTTFSIHLRTHLLASGDYIAAIPRSVLRLNAERFGLRELNVDMGAHPWPVVMVVLKSRTLSPVVELFLASLRSFVQSLDNLR
jgi:DNA-binding transcriptional LysR family regulator